MGDNIYLGDRNGVRTPMQWTPDRNGGFSRCDPARLYLPMIMDPVYGYEAVNVEAQSRSLASLLSWTKRLISVRKSSKVFGRGSLSFIRPANRSVLVYVRQYQGEVVLCVANLSRSAQAAEIDLSPWRGRIPFEMLGRTKFPPIGDGPYLDHARALRFLLVPALSSRDASSDRSLDHAGGIRDARRQPTGWRSLSQGQLQIRARTRRASRLSGRPPLVRGTRKPGDDRAHCMRPFRSCAATRDVGLAIIEAKGRARTGELPVAVDHQVDPARPWATQPERACRRAPRAAGGHPARCDGRSELHCLPAGENARLRRTIEADQAPHRIQADGRLPTRRPAGIRRRPRRRHRAVEHDRARRKPIMS